MSPMTQFFRCGLEPGAGRAIVAALLLASAAFEAHAQSTVSNVPNAMQGFTQNRDQPIQIEAASLEMRDKVKEATFSGNVKVVQGDTTMTSKTLVVFYEFERRIGHNAAGAHQCQQQCQGRCESSRRADAVGNPRSRRCVIDQAAGSTRQCGRGPEGPGRHRRESGV